MVKIDERMEVRLQMAELDRQIDVLQIKRATLKEMYERLWPREIIADDAEAEAPTPEPEPEPKGDPKPKSKVPSAYSDAGKSQRVKAQDQQVREAIIDELNTGRLKPAGVICDGIKRNNKVAYKVLKTMPGGPFAEVRDMLLRWGKGKANPPQGFIEDICKSKEYAGKVGYKLAKMPYKKLKKDSWAWMIMKALDTFEGIRVRNKDLKNRLIELFPDCTARSKTGNIHGAMCGDSGLAKLRNDGKTRRFRYEEISSNRFEYWTEPLKDGRYPGAEWWGKEQERRELAE